MFISDPFGMSDCFNLYYKIYFSCNFSFEIKKLILDIEMVTINCILSVTQKIMDMFSYMFSPICHLDG